MLRCEKVQSIETGVVSQKIHGKEKKPTMFWKLEPISNSLIWFLSSFSADQSSARTLNHRDFSPPRSLNMVAFLPFCLSNLRLRSEMNPQGVAWKSLSRPGAGLCHRCMHLRVPGLELWFLPDRIHNGES